MSKVTRATKMLEQAGIAFTIHSYNYDSSANRLGLQAAEALGEEPGRVLKTLMALVDGKPVCLCQRGAKEDCRFDCRCGIWSRHSMRS